MSVLTALHLLNTAKEILHTEAKLQLLCGTLKLNTAKEEYKLKLNFQQCEEVKLNTAREETQDVAILIL